MKTLWKSAWILALASCAAMASAETVLERIGAGGKLVIAHRESSVPFSYVDVQTGKPVGYAMDLYLRLAEVVRKKTDPKALKVVGRFLTTEPLAIMLPRKDPEFKKLADDEMRRLITSREIYAIYDRWFSKPIAPHGTVLNLPVSYLLRDFWKYPTDQVPF